MRVCIDARLGTGRFGGVEQVVIGIAAGLSTLEDGDEEYLFLTHAGRGRVDPAVPRRPLPPAPHAAQPAEPPRAGGDARTARAGCRRSARRFAVRPSDGTVERNGIDVMHFPFQDAFLTEVPSIYQPHDLQHLHLPELFSDWERAPPRGRSTGPTARPPTRSS